MEGKKEATGRTGIWLSFNQNEPILFSVQNGLLLSSLIIGFFVNLNYISIHRYYQDRLMETFMPDIPIALANKTGAAKGADGAALQDISTISDPTGPYHIVNTNVILDDSKVSVRKDRGATTLFFPRSIAGVTPPDGGQPSSS